MAGVGYSMAGAGYSIAGVGYSMAGVGYSLSGVGCSLSGVGYSMSGSGCLMAKDPAGPGRGPEMPFEPHLTVNSGEFCHLFAIKTHKKTHLWLRDCKRDKPRRAFRVLSVAKNIPLGSDADLHPEP